MSKDIDKDKRYFDEFDIENAKRIKHPLIKKAQADYTPPFDDDVFYWLSKQGSQTKQHVNNILREMMAIQKEKSPH